MPLREAAIQRRRFVVRNLRGKNGERTKKEQVVSAVIRAANPDQGLRRRISREAYKKILMDVRLSHGAFRLWHFLCDHLNFTRGDSIVWPGYRTITEGIGCRVESITTWLAELEKFGWVKITLGYKPNEKKRGGLREHSQYEVLDGNGEAILKTVTPSDTKNRNASKTQRRYGFPEKGDTKNRNAAILKTVSEVNSPSGNITKGSVLDTRKAVSATADSKQPSTFASQVQAVESAPKARMRRQFKFGS